MNDYLWDKSGEPDPEVERLENLLGSRCYEREPLRLPSVVRMDAPPPQQSHVRRSFAFRGIAAMGVAAGIVFVIIGGVWLRNLSEGVLTNRIVSQSSANDIQPQAPFGGLPREPPPMIDGSAGTISHSNENVGSGAAPRRSQVKRHARLVSVNQRRRTERGSGGYAQSEQVVARVTRRSIETSKSAGNDAVAENQMRVSDERRQAKEQLMIALRMTSMKLGVVRTKVQTMPGSGGGGTR